MSEFSQWAAPISKPQKTNHAVVCMWQPASSLRVLSWVFVLMRTWQAVDEITGAHLNRHPEAHLRSWWGQRQTHTCSWAHKDTHTQVKASMQTCLHCLLLSMAVCFSTQCEDRTYLVIWLLHLVVMYCHCNLNGYCTVSTVSKLISSLCATPLN